MLAVSRTVGTARSGPSTPACSCGSQDFRQRFQCCAEGQRGSQLRRVLFWLGLEHADHEALASETQAVTNLSQS